MTITTIGLEVGADSSLDVFDNVTHAGFGTGTTIPLVTNTALATEVGSRISVTKTKDDINNKYDFEIRVPITFYNSSTLTEVGLFDASSGGNMYVRKILPTSIVKTSDDEYIVNIRVKVNSTNG